MIVSEFAVTCVFIRTALNVDGVARGLNLDDFTRDIRYGRDDRP